MLATINLQYSAARDIQIAPEPIKTSLIHIFEKEIRLIQEENIKKEDAEESLACLYVEEFINLLHRINACSDRKELEDLIENNRSLIEKFSPLMHERTVNLKNLDFEEIKEKSRCILIPTN